MATSATNLTAPIAASGAAPHPADEEDGARDHAQPLVRLWYNMDLRPNTPPSHTVHLELATLELNAEQETVLRLSLFASDLISQIQGSLPTRPEKARATRPAAVPETLEQMDRLEAQMGDLPSFALTVRLSALYVSFSTDAVRLAVLSARSFEVDVATCPEAATAALALGNLQLWDLDHSTDSPAAAVPTEVFGRRDLDAASGLAAGDASHPDDVGEREDLPVLSPMVACRVSLRRQGRQYLEAAPCWGAVGAGTVASRDVSHVVELAVHLRIESIRFVMAAPFLVSAVRYFADGPLLRHFAPASAAPRSDTPEAPVTTALGEATPPVGTPTGPDTSSYEYFPGGTGVAARGGLQLRVEVELVSPTLVFPVSWIRPHGTPPPPGPCCLFSRHFWLRPSSGPSRGALFGRRGFGSRHHAFRRPPGEPRRRRVGAAGTIF